MFPVDIEGTVSLDGTVLPQHVPVITRELATAFSDIGAVGVQSHSDKLSFRGDFFAALFALKRTPLYWVGASSLQVLPGNPGRIRYEFSLLPLLLFVTGGSAFLAVFAVASGVRLWVPLAVFVFCWLWLFGPNYVITSLALRSIVRNTANLGGTGTMTCSTCGARYDPSDYRSDVEWHCDRCGSLLRHPDHTASPGTETAVPLT